MRQLKRLRKRLRLRQAELARWIGISQGRLSMLERGLRRPNADERLAIQAEFADFGFR